jgi:hypothetical protein
MSLSFNDFQTSLPRLSTHKMSTSVSFRRRRQAGLLLNDLVERKPALFVVPDVREGQNCGSGIALSPCIFHAPWNPRVEWAPQLFMEYQHLLRVCYHVLQGAFTRQTARKVARLGSKCRPAPKSLSPLGEHSFLA